MAIAPPTFVPDELVTATKMNLLPKGIIAYASSTTTQSGINAVTDLTGLTVTFTATASRLYKITGVVIARLVTAAAGSPQIQITTGANVIVNYAQESLATATSIAQFVPIALVTPAAGSVTYKLRAVLGVASLQVDAAATQPNYILVEDLGGV